MPGAWCCRVQHHAPGIESHGQALAGTLRVPNDARASTAIGPRRCDSRVQCTSHGVELVIPGQLLDYLVAIVLEDHKEPKQIEESLSLIHISEPTRPY